MFCMTFRCVVFFFKQKTAYEMRISDWSSDVCSSDLAIQREVPLPDPDIRPVQLAVERQDERDGMFGDCFGGIGRHARDGDLQRLSRFEIDMIETGASQGNQSRALAVKRGEYVLIESVVDEGADRTRRSEEHTSELQSLMRISYAVVCLKK